jgi:hypothetical protein
MGSALSTKLAAVEELYLLLLCEDQLWRLPADRTEFRRLLGQFRSVRILKVQCGLVEVAHSIRPDYAEPVPDPFPALEEIQLCLTSSRNITESQRATILEAFQPFVAARQQAGCPIKVVGNVV